MISFWLVTPNLTPRPLRGSIPPLVTPFRNGTVDERQYAARVEFQVAQGSHGILVNGTSAEPSTLTVTERNRLVDVALRRSHTAHAAGSKAKPRSS
jgi:dihydrodipicolinate synthase/N-acetylneuraminate lyase